MIRRLRNLAIACVLLPVAATAQSAPAPANRAVYLDSAGVIRWKDTRAEVALFGANYALPSASDFRAAGYLGLDRKKLVDVDMAHFARMGWDALRLATWGDWENADSAGNLIANEHLDLLDYVVAKARERGIYMLLTPIQTYDAGWPDSLAKSPTYPGFSRRYSRGELGTKPEAIAAEANYLRQLLNHVNPYTGVAYRDEPAILFVEMINEPWHHPEDFSGSVRYVDSLVAAVRSTGSRQLVFHNVSQDFAIARAIRASTVQGVTFGWYPTGLNSGHELQGNYLRTVDDYPPMRDSLLRALPRIVYEFDSPDLRTGYMYPAMARTFRSVGAQLATMFAYDFVGTASRNLGWQTHYLNLVYTPRKAMSAVIAAEAMRRLPRGQRYGDYPRNTRFGDFRVSYAENSAVLAADDAFMNAGRTLVAPPHPARLTRVAGYGSSPVVRYGGEGTYFLDRLRAGVWRLEVYPDAVPVADPFEPPRVDRVVTRAIRRSWPMTIRLPDLGATFTVERIAGDGVRRRTRAVGGRVDVRPGVYVLGARGPVSRASLPKFVAHLRLDEYHAPETDPPPARTTRPPVGVVAPAGPLRLFSAADAPRLAFTRIGDAGRAGVFRVVPAAGARDSALHVELPNGVDDYTASLVVKERVAALGESAGRAKGVRVRLRGVGPHPVLHLTLVEEDGTSWSAAVAADTAWSEQTIPLAALTLAKAAMLPQGFPGTWSYWMGPAAGRGQPGDRVVPANVERVQLSLRREDVASGTTAAHGAEVEGVWLLF